ncbi:IS110 family transposase [Paraburkholderia tropica]|uniref:IS110 family transposase n=1 Tax=Paraburkholderia tropica TaxID=92647 RepID=UPI003015E0BE
MLHFGIDVSRDKLDCAVVDEQGHCVKRGRTFKNDAEGVIELIRWAREIAVEQPRSFVMEATAAYHELAATRIHCAGLIVSVVNPAQVRALARGLGMLSKTDLIDALLLAHYSRLARPRQWRPAEPRLKDFSAMLMRLDCLEADLRRERNRREQAAVRGSAECVLSSIDACIEFLHGQCKAMRKTIDSHIVADDLLSASVTRLRTIPAVGEKTAMRMAAILTANSFGNGKQAAAYLGLVPVKCESGSSVRGRSRLSKAGNPRVRASLYMAAVVAKKINPDIKDLYDRLCAQGKTKMSALGACMRKLVHLCYGVLKSGHDYVRPEARSS